MKRTTLLLFIVSLIYHTEAGAQAYDLRLETVTNDAVTNGHFDVKVQIKSSTGSFNLGLGNLAFAYNAEGLYASVSPDDGSKAPEIYQAYNFNSGNYDPLTLTEPVRGLLSLNVNYDFESSGNGQTVGTSWMDVATIRFTIRNTMENTGLEWQDDVAGGDLNPVIVYNDALPGTVVSRSSATGNATALPVSYLFFTAAASEAENLLEWATATEENCERFDIECSVNALDWETIGEVPGSGNSINILYYQYAHRTSYMGTVYYRLKQWDYDGSAHYSMVVKVEGAQIGQQVALYPNPARHQVQVVLSGYGKASEYFIYSPNGVPVLEGCLPEGEQKVDISGISPGFYIMAITGLGNYPLMVE
ncbi:MAG: T9SS type A sorting domain-containing protein [Bacteroidetes bacterium]|jgi:hypothetical protein|nr:T9SS type A sorting domain-containing protein [Bacteroidota bacterium]